MRGESKGTVVKFASLCTKKGLVCMRVCVHTLLTFTCTSTLEHIWFCLCKATSAGVLHFVVPILVSSLRLVVLECGLRGNFLIVVCILIKFFTENLLFNAIKCIYKEWFAFLSDNCTQTFFLILWAYELNLNLLFNHGCFLNSMFIIVYHDNKRSYNLKILILTQTPMFLLSLHL